MYAVALERAGDKNEIDETNESDQRYSNSWTESCDIRERWTSIFGVCLITGAPDERNDSDHEEDHGPDMIVDRASSVHIECILTKRAKRLALQATPIHSIRSQFWFVVLPARMILCHSTS